jgi:Histidine phosphatase superfamily (branch 1)
MKINPPFRVFFASFLSMLFCLVSKVDAQTVPASAPLSSESSAPDPNKALPLAKLGRALRAGGYAIYFRHTSTDFSKNDNAMKGYDDCDNQRMLSAKGRDEARAIGRRVALLKLPAPEVLASPMCRTMETAQLMFGKVQTRNEMREAESGDYPGLKQLLATPVPPGGNRWLVGHGIPFRAVAGAPHLAEGEAAVIKPTGAGWTVVARILPSEWAALK